MKVKGMITVLILAAGIGLGAYYYVTSDKSAVNTVKTETQGSDKAESDAENNKPVTSEAANNEAVKGETEKSEGSSTAGSGSNAVISETEKQSKLVNKDIEAIQSVLKSSSIKASMVGDFSKDSKVTLNAASDKVSKISYVGESKGSTLSRTLTIALKYSTTDEFDITKYQPAKELIEKLIQSPLNDFEFSDGLTAKVSSSKDTKISYDFIAGDDYKISVDVNKNSAEAVTIKVELK